MLWDANCEKAAIGQGAAVVFDSLDTLKEGSLHNDTHLPTIMCWQKLGFDYPLCVGKCISF